MAVELVMGVKFCQLISNEWTEKDFETRRSFYRSFFIWKIAVTAIVYIIAFFVVSGWIDNNCEKLANPDMTDVNCSDLRSSLVFRLVLNEITGICINLYYCYVCKLYAELIEPLGHAARHYQNEASVSQSNYPPEFPAQQNHAYQPIPAQQPAPQQQVYQNQGYSQAPVYQGTNMDNAPPSAKG